MARPKNRIPSVAWKVYIPEPIAAQYDLLTMDPVTGIAPKGSKSELVAAAVEFIIAELTGTADKQSLERFKAVVSKYVPKGG